LIIPTGDARMHAAGVECGDVPTWMMAWRVASVVGFSTMVQTSPGSLTTPLTDRLTVA
jgi:hypothetical protein